MVFLFGLVIIYQFTLVSFAVYRPLYDSSSGEFCGTMFQCLVTVLHNGLISGMYDVRTANPSYRSRTRLSEDTSYAHIRVEIEIDWPGPTMG